MAYQLRFLKSSPISAWLNQTTGILEIFIHKKNGLSNNSISSGKNRGLIRKALVKGLSTFLVKRSLCDIRADCDIGLQPAVENESDDRFEAGVINAPVKRYLFQDNTNLDGAVQKMTETLLNYVPEAHFVEHKVKLILNEALACHLFENKQCFHHAHCRHSLIQKIGKDFASPRFDFKIHFLQESL
jgi:hypothetical protein